MMKEDQNRFKAKFFKALGDPVRLELLELLREGEKCVCELVSQLRIPQPLVSRHLRILKECGLVKARAFENRRYYSVTDSRIFSVVDGVTQDLRDSLYRILIEQMA
ncbi:MAG: metalloregulator ArsR/SmtB family transcription factor [Candidatus Bathyarchaeia archaeon]